MMFGFAGSGDSGASNIWLVCSSGASIPGSSSLIDCLYVLQGCDFMRNHSISHIDFCTIHLWPDSWLQNASDDKKLDFSRHWIDCHVQCCQDLGKPLVITEFGKKPAGPGRAVLYNQVTIPSTVSKSLRCQTRLPMLPKLRAAQSSSAECKSLT